MQKIYRQGAVGALLDEYEKAIAELQQTLNSITGAGREDIYVQDILHHVVKSGYAYAGYIQQYTGTILQAPEQVPQRSVKQYQAELEDMFAFTVTTLQDVSDSQLEELDNSKKIISSWGQLFDIEQMMEHAIVHILRHRRQIEKIISNLNRQ